MRLDLIPIQWRLQAISVLFLFEFEKVAFKRILGTFFQKFHQTPLDGGCSFGPILTHFFKMTGLHLVALVKPKLSVFIEANQLNVCPSKHTFQEGSTCDQKTYKAFSLGIRTVLSALQSKLPSMDSFENLKFFMPTTPSVFFLLQGCHDMIHLLYF